MNHRPLFISFFLLAIHCDVLGFELRITEVMFQNTTMADGDGDYSGWVEIRNPGPEVIMLQDYSLSHDLSSPQLWQLPIAELKPGAYAIVWFSGKNKIHINNDIHIEDTWNPNWKSLFLYSNSRNLIIDSLSLQHLPNANFSIGRFPELSNEWVIYPRNLISKGCKNSFPGKWQNLSSKSSFSPRDNSPNSILVYNDQVWILSGEVRDELAMWTGVTDVWKSRDLLEWEQVNFAAPYRHISSFVVFNDQMWAFDGNAYSSVNGVTWEKRITGVPFRALGTRIANFQKKLINVTGREVYESYDGINWNRILEEAPFEQRDLFHLVSFNDKLWFLGGMNNYGKEFMITYNDVWSSEDGIIWTQVTEAADWQGRLWPTVIAYDNKLWLMGGWDYFTDDGGYLTNYGNLNDVWYTSDGTDWIQVKEKTVWPNRHAMYTCIFNDQLVMIAGYGGGGVARLYNDVWKLNLKEFRPIALDTTARVYGDMPFQIAGSAHNQQPKYYSFNKEVVKADGDTELSIEGSGSARILITQDEDQFFYPLDTITEVMVRKKDLIVKIESHVKEFGEPIPVFDIEYDGFVYNEDIADLDSQLTIDVKADQYSPIGSYEISMSMSPESNYRPAVKSGMLTIVDSKRNVLLYPNPSSGVLNIVTSQLVSNGDIEIMDISGRIVKVFSLTPGSNRYIIGVKDLNQGLYYYRLRDSQFVHTGKFVMR